MSQQLSDEKRVLDELRLSRGRTDIVEARLTTDERVIARVTDGIYRQPGSAIRELISNAYDADATSVTVLTDAPRFGRIVVEDNGHGMTPEVLTRLLHHIGGSAKRTRDGSELGITKAGDPSLSPGGRKLIGKIGIGLFSISQLTQSFQIVTKVKNDDFSTVATVVLKQYKENESEARTSGETYEAGRVKIWREPSPFPDTHGTAITLTGIRPAVRKILKSASMWDVIDSPHDEDESWTVAKPPVYHIGRTDSSEMNIRTDHGAHSNLPWGSKDTADIAFRKLVHAVWDEVGKGNPNPQLERVLDYYLQMIWGLSLALPIPYVDGHLFREPFDDWASFFKISNTAKGAATKLASSGSEFLVEDAFQLKKNDYAPESFEVNVDGLLLRRPIRFRNLPTTGHAIRKPMVFIGESHQEFPNVPTDFSGGELEFQAYLFWTPKVAPTEHRGSLVRIHGASGTLFDETFMRYQISEQTRLKQITCEIFVSKGLEAALNIDRESFNTSHPHVVYLTRWLHSALRQLANAQKAEARRLRQAARANLKEEHESRLSDIVEEVWSLESGDMGQPPPEIFFAPQETRGKQGRSSGMFYEFAAPSEIARLGNASANTIGEPKMKALLQVLAAFDVLESVDFDKRQRLVTAIFRVLSGNDE